MDQSVKTLKRRLVELSSLANKSSATSKKIIHAASERLDVVNKNILKIRPRVIQDEESAKTYRKLIHERGKLTLLLGKR